MVSMHKDCICHALIRGSCLPARVRAGHTPQRDTVIAARACFAALKADSVKIDDFVGAAYT